MDNKMLCFQCEQTAGCSGCTGNAGVCGKDASTAKLQDELTGALIGLVKTCGSSTKTENTDRIIIEGLFTTITNVNFNNQTFQDMIDKVHNEKNIISPGCSACETRCGNTDDYDMENLWKESEEIGAFKNTILMVICQTAAKLYHADQTEESETVKLLFRALRMISFEGWDVAGLIPVMLELGKAGRI